MSRVHNFRCDINAASLIIIIFSTTYFNINVIVYSLNVKTLLQHPRNSFGYTNINFTLK